MSCGPLTPVFWQRQPKLPQPVLRFLASRIEAALRSPADRALLVWPMVLGAPALRQAHPDGISGAELLVQASPMLASIGVGDPAASLEATLARFPDTADHGPTGWVPHRIWDPMSALVSLRLGVALIALLGQPQDARYGLHSGVALFNSALFHECHDALEPLWVAAEGPLKAGLQGLIMLAGGFHHLQLHNARGMISLWQDALPMLAQAGDSLETPWGRVGFGPAAAAAAERLTWLLDYDGDMDLDPLWGFSRPVWELL
jgi:hypothetical protein